MRCTSGGLIKASTALDSAFTLDLTQRIERHTDGETTRTNERCRLTSDNLCQLTNRARTNTPCPALPVGYFQLSLSAKYLSKHSANNKRLSRLSSSSTTLLDPQHLSDLSTPGTSFPVHITSYPEVPDVDLPWLPVVLCLPVVLSSQSCPVAVPVRVLEKKPSPSLFHPKSDPLLLCLSLALPRPLSSFSLYPIPIDPQPPLSAKLTTCTIHLPSSTQAQARILHQQIHPFLTTSSPKNTSNQ